MAISRLFFEISGDSSKLQTELDKAVAHAKEAGVNMTASGKRFVSAFDDAVNPTRKLTEQLTLLEKAGKSQADIMNVMGDKIASATKEAQKMGQPIDDLIKKYTSLQAKLKETGQGLEDFGRNASMYLTVPLVAVGAAAMKAAGDFNAGVHEIRKGTGATGDALKNMSATLNEMWGEFPDSARTIGIAIADLNTRLGLTGTPLREMAEQMLNLSRVTGGDLHQTIMAATRVFGDWSIATKNQAESMNFMFRMSQNTGINMQRLMETVVQFGAPMRALGFTFEAATAAIGKWEKEGVNMETVLAGLKMGLGDMAKAGADPVRVLKETQEAIKNAKTDAEALSIGLKVFGQRAAVDMTKAIQEGRFNLEELIETTKRGSDTINKAEEDTKTFGERMEQLQQKTEKALVPLGEKLLQTLTSLMPMLTEMADDLAKVTKGFSELDPATQKGILAIVGVTAVLGPLAFALGSTIKMVANLTDLISKAGGLTAVITKLGTAAAVVGTVFAGWKIGEWIDSFDLFGRHAAVSTNELYARADKLKQQAEVIGLVASEQDKLNKLVEQGKLSADNAKTLGSTMFERNAAEPVQEYNKRMQEMIDAYVKLHPEAQKLLTKLKDTGAAAKDTAGGLATLESATAGSAGGLASLDEKLASLRESFTKALTPADVMAEEMKKLISAGIPAADVIKVYGNNLIEAAEKQEDAGKKLRAGTQNLLDQSKQSYFENLSAKDIDKLLGIPTEKLNPYQNIQKAQKDINEQINKIGIDALKNLKPSPIEFPVFEFKIDDTFPEWLLKIQKQMNDSLKPMDALTKSLGDLRMADFSNADILKLNYEAILKAADAQIKYGGTLDDNEKKLVAQARAIDVTNKVMAKAANLSQPTKDSVKDYKKMMDKVDELRVEGVLSEKNATQLRYQLHYELYQKQLTSAEQFFGTLAGLSRSSNRTLAIIGKASAVAQATIDGFLAIQKALASTAPPWNFAIAAAVAVVTAANVAQMIATPIGFSKGGLVPGGNQIINVNETGQEFVMNARATKDNLPFLNALNAGMEASMGPGPMLRGGMDMPNMSINIANYGTSKNFEVERLDESNIRIIARDEATSVLHRRGPEVIANDIASPNSRTSKAIFRNTTARRAR
jgi:phage-related minor tail protein